MIFRVRFHQTAGQHVRCRLFVAPGANRTFAMCGEFTVRAGEEFEALVKAFNAEFVNAELISAEDDVGTVELAGAAEIGDAMKQCLK